MGISIVPFDPGLMDAIKPRWPAAIGDASAVRDAVGNGNADNARIALVDGVPVGAGGAIEMWPGVGHAWVLAGEVEPSLSFQAVRACRAFLDELQRPGRFHRLQADIRCGFFQAMRFAELLGFEDEYTMKAYSADKSDYRRFARVRV